MTDLPSETSKSCTKCGQIKSLSAFVKDPAKPGGRRARCKACHAEGVRRRKAANRDVENQRNREWHHANKGRWSPTQRRARWLRARYGLTLERHGDLEQLQGGCCAICREPFDKTPRVDHDHATGMVRGLLCHSCNVALGHFRDSPAIVAQSLRYLNQHGKPLLADDLDVLYGALSTRLSQPQE